MASSILKKLKEADSDIVVMPRELKMDLRSEIEHAPIGECRVSVPCFTHRLFIQKNLAALKIDSELLLNDIGHAVELFGALVDQASVELRMELTNVQTCPKFHCDNVFLRMLITYLGPTTEYIDRDSPDQVYSAPLNALVFLKGHKNPSYQERILHRSPSVPKGQKRFCIVVNFER